jgi:hypothetical protein
MPAIRMPITNENYHGDYTATIFVGSNASPVTVILDTGSSTLAIQQQHYKAARDTARKATSWAQSISYGSGAWAGPLVRTRIACSKRPAVGIDGIVALAIDQEDGNFSPAGGILGLAYDSGTMNEAYNLEAHLKRRGVTPPVTYPWPFFRRNSRSAIEQFMKIVGPMPRKRVLPYFSQLVDQRKIKNTFAFYTHRSVPKAGANQAVNRGLFILGGGEEQRDLYTGPFTDVAVVHDVWYNTSLKAVQVEGANRIAMRPLRARFKKWMVSNSIFDSGTNTLSLSEQGFWAIMRSFEQIDPQLALIAKAARKAQLGNHTIPNARVTARKWPNIHFIFAGKHATEVTLTCSPATYWQFDAPKRGQATFQIDNMGEAQSIFGLPIFNNYYMIFDRSQDRHGVIRCAQKQLPYRSR